MHIMEFNFSYRILWEIKVLLRDSELLCVSSGSYSIL
jgi:hypothetical protein